MSSEKDEKQVGVVAKINNSTASNIDWQRFLDINEVSRLADSHYREIQYTIYAVGATGALLVLRSLRLFTKFTTVRKIPDSYFRKQVKLQGFVRSVEGGAKATLNVEHIPIVEMSYHKRARGLLPVRLAGLGTWHEPAASKFVADKVLNKRITFQLVEEGPKEEFLIAAVTHKPYWWLLRSRSLNAEMVEQGLSPYIYEDTKAGVEVDEKRSLFKPQPVEHKLAEKLMIAQRQAQKKRLGVWQEVTVSGADGGDDSAKSLTKSLTLIPAGVKNSFNAVRSVTSAVGRGVRYTVSAIVYFPAQVKDKILQRRSIS